MLRVSWGKTHEIYIKWNFIVLSLSPLSQQMLKIWTSLIMRNHEYFINAILQRFFMYLLSSPVRGNADHKMETIFRNQMNVLSVPNWHKVEHVQKYFQQQWNTANPDHSLDYLIITVFCEFWHKVISGYLTTSSPHTNTQTVDPALQFIVSFLSQAL